MGLLVFIMIFALGSGVCLGMPTGVSFVCDALCQRQCELLAAEAGDFGSFGICVEECRRWKSDNCRGICRVLGIPNGQKAEEFSTVPPFITFKGGTFSFCLSYETPVFVAEAVFSEDMSQMWWITKNCELSKFYTPLLAGESNRLCSDVPLPVRKGWIMWVASYGDVFSIDWERDSYTFFKVHFDTECTPEHPENCPDREECERVGGYWCLTGCQRAPCRSYSCVEDCSKVCSGDPGCMMECWYVKVTKCGFFSCAFSCSELCGGDTGCRSACLYWQEANCAYERAFVCDLPCVASCGGNWACMEGCLSWSLDNCFVDFSGNCSEFCRVYSSKGPPELRDRCLYVCEEYRRETSTLYWLGGVPW